MEPALVGAIITAVLGALVAYLNGKQQAAADLVNAIALATQQAMLTSTALAQAVQANMATGAATVPVITDMASAQAAFGIGTQVALPTPQPKGYPNTTIQNTKRSIQILKGWGLRLVAVVLLLSLTACGRPKAGAVAQYPTIDTTPPPQVAFSHPEIPLSDREKGMYQWSADLYKRVTIYNTFAISSNQAHGYYAPGVTTANGEVVAVPATTNAAQRMFE